MFILLGFLVALVVVPLDIWAAAFAAIGWILKAPFRGMAWVMLWAFAPELLDRDKRDRR